jgi:hypothetical protein
MSVDEPAGGVGVEEWAGVRVAVGIGRSERAPAGEEEDEVGRRDRRLAGLEVGRRDEPRVGLRDLDETGRVEHEGADREVDRRRAVGVEVPGRVDVGAGVGVEGERGRDVVVAGGVRVDELDPSGRSVARPDRRVGRQRVGEDEERHATATDASSTATRAPVAAAW